MVTSIVSYFYLAAIPILGLAGKNLIEIIISSGA